MNLDSSDKDNLYIPNEKKKTKEGKKNRKVSVGN